MASWMSSFLPQSAPMTPDEAQASPRAVQILLTQAIDAPADRVWQALGPDFVRVGEWATLLEDSAALTASDVPEGWTTAPAAPVPGRRTFASLGTIDEFLIAYDPDARSYTFRAHGLPGVIRYSQNHTTVEPLEDGTSLVTFDILMVPKLRVISGLLRNRFRKGLGGVLVDLKTWVETGVSARAGA